MENANIAQTDKIDLIRQYLINDESISDNFVYFKKNVKVLVELHNHCIKFYNNKFKHLHFI